MDPFQGERVWKLKVKLPWFQELGAVELQDSFSTSATRKLKIVQQSRLCLQPVSFKSEENSSNERRQMWCSPESCPCHQSSVSGPQRWERSWEDGGGQVHHGLHLQSVRRWIQSPGESCSSSLVFPAPPTWNIVFAANGQDVEHSPHAWVQWAPHMFFTLRKAAPFLPSPPPPPSTLYFSLVGLQTGRCSPLKPNKNVMFNGERPTPRSGSDQSRLRQASIRNHLLAVCCLLSAPREQAARPLLI